MRKILGFILLAILAGCSDSDSVSTGLFSTTTIDVESFNDPQISGITCHISHVNARLSLSDPSNMAIACRQTGPLAQDIAQIDLTKPVQVFKESKSVLFKSLKVRRMFDEENQTIIYLSYSTKETSGSFKNSVSTVPLYGTDAWKPVK